MELDISTDDSWGSASVPSLDRVSQAYSTGIPPRHPESLVPHRRPLWT